MTEAVWIALIVNTSGIIGLIIKSIRDTRAKKAGNNPHPCKAHEDKLDALDDKLDQACERISRIEGKLNGMKK